MTTRHLKAAEIQRGWHLVDAEGQVMGRIASRIAKVLMGKHRPVYSPHQDTGEFVVVINADKVKVTGNKRDQRMIRYHTGWVGGLKEKSLGDLLDTKPEQAFELAVRRMLPKTKLGRKMFKKLKVYAGKDHPHVAQDPQPLDCATV